MRAVIFVQGGLVQEVLTDDKLDYIIVDQDCCSEDESCELRDVAGNAFTASITEYKTSPSVKNVEHYFNQIPPM